MREVLTRLEEQVRRAFEGEAWHGPAVSGLSVIPETNRCVRNRRIAVTLGRF